MTVKERIQALRSLMLKHNIAAVIVPDRPSRKRICG